MTDAISGCAEGEDQDVAATRSIAGDGSRSRPILALSSLMDDETRVLKHGDTFAVFDHFGDINPGGLGEEGLYHDGTRHLSSLSLELAGNRPFFLSSTIGNANDQLSVALTNPDLIEAGRVCTPLGTLHLAFGNSCGAPAATSGVRSSTTAWNRRAFRSPSIHADFADIFEVRGMRREARGQDLAPSVSGSEVTLSYRGLDGLVRRTRIRFSPFPSQLSVSSIGTTCCWRLKKRFAWNGASAAMASRAARASPPTAKREWRRSKTSSDTSPGRVACRPQMGR